MTEFTHGMHNAFKKILSGSSLALALIYTFGHVIIAMTVVSLLTGASLWEAGLVALVEPYLAHRLETYEGDINGNLGNSRQQP